MNSKSVSCILIVICIHLGSHQTESSQVRCVTCRSRGDLGSCKDRFTMNATDIVDEHGVEAVSCQSGWCGKIIERPDLNNEWGTATQRMCLRKGPDDGEERCADTIKNYRQVLMCMCAGDMCNGTVSSMKNSGFLLPALLSFLIIRWWL